MRTGQHEAVDEWITYRQAAEILDCGLSNIPKLIDKGHLHRRLQDDGRRVRRACLNLAEVTQLAEQRRALAAQSKNPPRRYVRLDHRPDHEHLWLSPAEAANQIGVTAQAIRQRIKRGRLPAVENGGRVWVRADHFHAAEAARSAMRTRQP